VLLEKLEWCGADILPLYKIKYLEIRIRTMNMGSGETIRPVQYVNGCWKKLWLETFNYILEFPNQQNDIKTFVDLNQTLIWSIPSSNNFTKIPPLEACYSMRTHR
jgi:hypothetical protein